MLCLSNWVSPEMDTLTTNVVEQFKEKIDTAFNRTTAKKKDVLFAVEFKEGEQDGIAEAHNQIVSTHLPRNNKSIPASVIVMNDGKIDVQVPIGLTKSQRNKVIDMNTKDKGKIKVKARLLKVLEERQKKV